MQIVMDKASLEAFIARDFTQVSRDFRVEAVTDQGLDLRLLVTEAHLRPGGTVSGPTMFALADVAVYLAILSRIGPKALSVTTNCSIDFMRKPAADRDVIGRARLLKLGKQLAIGDVLMFSEGLEAPVARASLTYSIPPK